MHIGRSLVLTFGLSLAPHTFYELHGCSPLPPLRILNYLNDWLILAQLRHELCAHRSLLLNHLKCLAKSSGVSFLGAVFDSAQMLAGLSPQISQRLPALFKVRTLLPLRTFQRLLGLIAAASSGISLGLLLPHAWCLGHLNLRVTHGCIKALALWKTPRLYQLVIDVGLVSRRNVVMNITSSLGWGALCDGRLTFGSWLILEQQ